MIHDCHLILPICLRQRSLPIILKSAVSKACRDWVNALVVFHRSYLGLDAGANKIWAMRSPLQFGRYFYFLALDIEYSSLFSSAWQ